MGQIWPIWSSLLPSSIPDFALHLRNFKKWCLYRWQISIWKDAPHHMSSGKCKLKQQWDTTTQLLEWPKSRTLTTPNVGWQNSYPLLVGMQNGTRTLEETLAVSCKTKHSLTIWSSNYAPWYLPKEIENLCPHKNLHTGVYSSFNQKCENLEATKMSFSRWMDK